MSTESDLFLNLCTGEACAFHALDKAAQQRWIYLNCRFGDSERLGVCLQSLLRGKSLGLVRS